jgi:polysaccharide export outer membrane protein
MVTNRFAISKIIAVLVLLTIMASAQQTQGGANRSKTGSSKEAPASFGQKGADEIPPAATNDPDYVIGPEDSLHVSVWKEPDLSGQVPVRPDGKISLPLLNDVQAAGNTPMKLASILTQQLQQYVTDPHVTVVVTAINSKRVFLVGEVGHVGALNMLPNMTVLQALASAGGFTQFASLKKIYILRNENGKQIRIPVNYKAIVTGQSPEQNIPLKPGDTIVVP